MRYASAQIGHCSQKQCRFISPYYASFESVSPDVCAWIRKYITGPITVAIVTILTHVAKSVSHS